VEKAQSKHVLSHERRALEKKLRRAARGGGNELQNLIAVGAVDRSEWREAGHGEVAATDTKALQRWRRA